MSIVTLKKKSQVKYNNMSVQSKTGFSLNGTHRNQGYVGQTSLSRSFPSTLMKGNTARGHGGCCGKYLQTPIVQSAVNSLNDSSVIKPSVIGTSGMISTGYRWIKRPAPYISVKPDSTLNSNSQNDYIDKLARTTISTIKSINEEIANGTSLPNCDNNSRSVSSGSSSTSYKKFMSYGSYLYRNSRCNIIKAEDSYKPMKSGDKTRMNGSACANNDVSVVQKQTNGAPFAGNN